MATTILCERCDFKKGDIIDNRYFVEKLLGEGTFGMVFRVHEINSGQIYALKLLKLWKEDPHCRMQLMKRFDMEYETGRIASNYLVHSYQKGTVVGNPYIIMEFCSGGDLMSAAEAGNINFAAIATQVLYGLGDLHKCGKVHRDLKPENVLFRADGSAVLTDFGISGDQNKRATERGITGIPKQIFGTYGYMPPEQINPPRGNATVLPTTDIFSFGVMMYQMLTYELPFGKLETRSDLTNYVENGSKGNWDRGRLLRIPQGRQWLKAIEGCLVPKFKERLQSVEEVLALLPEQSHTFYRPAKEVGNKLAVKIENGVLLRIMQGEEYGKIYKLNELLSSNCGVLTMGRQDDEINNRIPIREEESCYVSRKHCTLEWDFSRKQWIIRDGQWVRTATNGWQNSLNGTFVNSSEVTMNGMPIRPGDIISIGDVKLRVEGY